MEDALGLATVQSGLWGLWNTVSNVGVVKAAMSTAKDVTDRAVHHVNQHGIMQSAIDGAQVYEPGEAEMGCLLFLGCLAHVISTFYA